MLDIILNGVFWVLALYGLIEIVKNIIYIVTYTDLKSDGIYMIIAAKNQEDKIEGFLRSIMFRLFYEKDLNFKNIVLADLDSTDNTKEIMERFQEDYDFLKTTNWKDCKNMMDNIKEN